MIEDQILGDVYSEKTVLSPNYAPPKDADAAKRKSISFNSPHNLGGLKKHFVFPGTNAAADPHVHDKSTKKQVTFIQKLNGKA